MEKTPIYIFTGFLEGGKTSIIQESLNDEKFNSGEKTLVILCEEGEIELDASPFWGKNVTIHVIDSKDARVQIHRIKLKNLFFMVMLLNSINLLPLYTIFRKKYRNICKQKKVWTGWGASVIMGIIILVLYHLKTEVTY